MIALYSRVSTSEQALNGHSISEQNERMTKFADALGLKNAKIYSDAGFTGANMQRPALQEMIKDIQQGKVSKVIVYKLDRLSRSQRDTLYLIEDVFLKNNCDFISMNENFDTSSPFGRAMIGILSVFAQLEREQIKERMMMGKEARAKKGKWHGGGHPPIGYDYKDGELVVNDFYAMQVREMFDLFAHGMTASRICDTFNEKGYKTQFGNKWNVTQVRRTLSHKVYIGMATDGKNWFQGTHKPIIDEKTFETVAKILKDNSDRFKATGISTNPKNISAPLSGMLFCKQCGGRYSRCHALHNGKAFEYYGCYSRSKKSKEMIVDPNCKNKYWKQSELDELVFDEIRKLKLEDIKRPEKKKVDETAVIRKRIDEIDSQISRFLDLYGKGTFDIESLEAKVNELKEEREKLEAQITAQNDSKSLSEKEVEKYINSLKSALKKGNFIEIRGIVCALIDKIELDNEDVTIHWKFN